jgi:hypothetical protein
MSTSPTIEEIKARRRKIAEEDKVLAEIERNLEEVADKWRRYQAGVANNVAHRQFVQPSLISATTKVFEPTVIRGPAPPKARTKNQMIVEALHSPRPLWQTANEIQEFVSLLDGKDVPMSSISPALSALKKDGTIVRSDKVVALALRLEDEQTKEAPTEESESASKPETAGTEDTELFSKP